MADSEPVPDYTKVFFCGTCPFPPGNANWAVAYAFPVAISSLVRGNNTLEIATDGTSSGYPPIVANIELLTFGGMPALTSTATLAPTNTPSPQVPGTWTPTATPTAVARQRSYVSHGNISQRIVRRGSSVSFTASITSLAVSAAAVDVEVWSPSGVKIFQHVWDNQAFAAGQTRAFRFGEAMPVTAAPAFIR